MKMKRGAFIVFEGCDRSGKSTQCRKLVESLVEMGVKAEQIQFPDRSTVIGNIINNYLANKQELSDQAIHLLFTANRWERENKMRQLLHQGVTLVADRYSFSGVAYTSAKPGMDMEWCKAPEGGLPKPDLVFLLSLASDERHGFGDERYEKREFQEIVYKNYMKMMNKTWRVIDSNRTIDDVHKEVMGHVMEAIKNAETTEVENLW